MASLLPDRCSLHPDRCVVGVCSLCLHDRLRLLMESAFPDAASDGGHEARRSPPFRPVSADEFPRAPLPPPFAYSFSRGRSVSGCNPDTQASAETVLHHHYKLEATINTALQKVKQAHQQLSFVAHSPYQGVITLGPAASPLPNGHASLPASRRRSNASVADMNSFPGAMDSTGKRKGSWFSIAKGKSPALNAPSPRSGRRHDDKTGSQSSNQAAIFSGRKSASDAIGRSCSSYKQAYMDDLGSISEIHLGDAAITAERSGETRANSSWISSLFHRRKGTRHRTNEQQDVGLISSGAGSKSASTTPAKASASTLPLPSLEPGRLSWDGPRPSLKQMLKRIETRKKQQRVDCSPLRSFETVNGSSVCSEDAMLGSFHSCKSAETTRKSTIADMPRTSSKAEHLSTLLHRDNSTNLQAESCTGHSIGREPRSWGKAWNRTLSPLLGFRAYSGKDMPDLDYQHQGYGTKRHVHHRSFLAGAPSSANPYLSPLSSRQCGPDAQIQIAH